MWKDKAALHCVPSYGFQVVPTFYKGVIILSHDLLGD
jgi:hypothetical protein